MKTLAIIAFTAAATLAACGRKSAPDPATPTAPVLNTPLESAGPIMPPDAGIPPPTPTDGPLPPL